MLADAGTTTHLSTSTRIGLGLLAAGLLYCASLYENERRQLVSTLDALWVTVEERRENGEGWTGALFAASTGGVSWLSERLFGNRILSFRAVVMACSLPALTMVAGLSYYFALQLTELWGALKLLAWCCVLAGCATTLALRSSRRSTMIAVLVLAASEVVVLGVSAAFSWGLGNPGAVAGFAVGLVLTLAILTAQRLVLQWCAGQLQLRRIVGAVLLNGVMVALSVILPLSYSRALNRKATQLTPVQQQYSALSTQDIEELLPSLTRSFEEQAQFTADAEKRRSEALRSFAAVHGRELRDIKIYEQISNGCRGVALASISASIVAALPLVLLCVLLFHRMVYSVAARTLYSLGELGIIENRRLLALAGLALLGMVLGDSLAAKVLGIFH